LRTIKNDYIKIPKSNQCIKNVFIIANYMNVVKINTYAHIINKKHFVKNAVDRKYALIINIKLVVKNVVDRKYAHIINTNNGVMNAISL